MTNFTLPESTIRRPPTLIRDQVAEYLRDAIFRLALAPGTQLIEREICEATTASRATVREALRQLESEGLVRSMQGRGTIVAGLTAREAEEIYEVRAQLEGLAARLFVERASDRLVRELEEAVKELAGLVNDPPRMIQAKSTFYDVLFEGAENTELHRVAIGLRQRITLAQSNSLSVPGRSEHALAEIQNIVAAITRRDAEEAVRLTVEHIQAASRTVSAHRESEQNQPE